MKGRDGKMETRNNLMKSIKNILDWADEWGLSARDERDQEEIEYRINKLRTSYDNAIKEAAIENHEH